MSDAQLGDCYYAVGDADRALLHYTQEFKSAKRSRDKSAIAQAYRNLGNAFKAKKAIEKSIDCFRRYAEVSSKLGDSLAEAQALDNLGNAYHALGNACAVTVWLRDSSTISLGTHYVGVTPGAVDLA